MNDDKQPDDNQPAEPGTAPSNPDPIPAVDKKNATGEHSPGGSGDSVADDANRAANQLDPPKKD